MNAQLKEVEMIGRILLPFLVLAAVSAFGQSGFFGPVTARLKAGDVAPDLAFTRVLNNPEHVGWTEANLSGKITVLVFFPDTTDNLESVTAWNALIEQFSGKPVQFIWITAEKESSLLQWIGKHPVHGWVFLDSDGKTGRSYGLKQPQTVFIGTDRRIAGFDFGFVPTEDLMNAVLEGRITTAPVQPGKAAMKAFIESHLMLLQPEPRRMERIGAHKPDFAPSYTVHIAPSQKESAGNFGGDDYWSLKGYDLKAAIHELYGVNQIRLDLPAALDGDKRYDFALVLPEPESTEQMRDRFRQGLQNYFHATATRQQRLLDVYVMTAPDKTPHASHPRNPKDGGFFSSYIKYRTPGGLDEALDGPKPMSIDGIAGVSMEGTADAFCHLLEGELDRPMVNETNLRGEFEFSVESSKESGNDFLKRLRDQTGIAITPAERTVEILVFEMR
jgi:uncharacterized protein (TIGR03435 family)